MARNESDREDLMREAVALVRRIELQVADEDEHVICGFRRNGALAIYFGPDPVYQFDAEARLRRAYVDGLLYRTQGETLAELKRQRGQTVSQLLRRDLSVDELAEFVRSMQARIGRLLHALESNAITVVLQVSPVGAIIPDLIDSLRQILNNDGALAPRIKGKR